VEFIEVRPVPPPSIPAPPRRGTPTSSAIDPKAAPIVVPDDIAPETGFEPFETSGSNDGVPAGIPNDGVPGSMLTDVPVPPPPPAEKPAKPIRVGGSIRQPQKIHHVAPIYPAIAQSARVEGTVILDATIGEDGRIRNLRLLRSIPLLDNTAMDAVRQWQFTPTLLNGEPVPVVMTVTVTFTLHP
jgi:protein TonB